MKEIPAIRLVTFDKVLTLLSKGFILSPVGYVCIYTCIVIGPTQYEMLNYGANTYHVLLHDYVTFAINNSQDMMIKEDQS